MKKKRDTAVTVIFIVIFLTGISVMLYPSFSNWWNRHMASHTISSYKEEVAKMDDQECERILAEAYAYNEKLAELNSPLSDFEQIKGYYDILNVSGTGVMGYISIPNINVELPVYHGTSEGVLQIASGHIQGSSLPVGGISTHAVISGHRGLPSAKLFSDLDKMVEGDTFTINILNEVLTYEVEKILIILPDESDKLSIVPGEDIVTLLTCTPYGVNSHRLLVRAHRIETIYDKRIKVSADALQVDNMTVIPIVFVPLLIMLFVFWHISGKHRKTIHIDKYTVHGLPENRRDKHDKN